MNSSTVTRSPSFEVLIPLEIREALHLTAGEELRILPYAGRVELIPVRTVQSMRGFLKGMDVTIERDEDEL